jgi:pyruvate/2-oxoglutarate dehydrogenase complex dihydrolipoamide dehydrogenase (E3) component
VVIGSGSAGFAAARTAATAGARTAIIEKGPEIAGLCILRGCMPSKILLASSNRLHDVQTADELGIDRARGVANLSKIIARKRKLVAEFAAYREGQIRKGDFDFFRGAPEFIDQHTVQWKGRKISSKSFVICTGSRIACHAFEGLKDVSPMDSDSALNCRRLPRSLAVLGGGPVALELGQYFSRLGSRVTMLQRSSQLLSKSDADLGGCIRESFEHEGIRVLTGVKLKKFQMRRKMKMIHFERGGRAQTLAVDEILCALGRTPNADTLGLDRIGVRRRRGAIEVDQTMRSSVPNIFAAGDVNGRHDVVHIGVQEGELAGRNAARDGRERIDERTVALVVFTEPEVAMVGRSERDLEGKKVLVAKYSFADHGKSLVIGKTEGFVKLITEPRHGRILGAQCVGPAASEIIHEMIALIHKGGTVFDVIRMPHYHPTLSEIWTCAAEAIVGKPSVKDKV